jgi:hypothetical protein
MQTRTYNVYKFDELSEDAKQKAIKKYYDINVDFEYWAQFELDENKKKLEEMGYYDVKILYSGFGSQGDGACFEARVNVPKFIRNHKKEDKFPMLMADSDLIFCVVKHSGHYYHENSTSVDTCSYFDSSSFSAAELEAVDKEIIELEKLIDLDRIQEGKRIYKELGNLYDHLTSHEAIIETLKANDYDFTEDGKID